MLSFFLNSDDDRRDAMGEIMIIFKQRLPDATWDEYFSTVLLALIDLIRSVREPTTNADYDIRLRALTLIAQMATLQPERMERYAEYVLVEVLEAHSLAASSNPREDMDKVNGIQIFSASLFWLLFERLTYQANGTTG